MLKLWGSIHLVKSICFYFSTFRNRKEQTMAVLGTQLRNLRIQKGYSQSDMAEKMHISQSAYAKIESGKTNVDLERLDQIARILEVDWQEILSQSDTKRYYFRENKIQNAVVENLTIGLKEAYEKHIESLKKEIAYLKELLAGINPTA